MAPPPGWEASQHRLKLLSISSGVLRVVKTSLELLKAKLIAGLLNCHTAKLLHTEPQQPCRGPERPPQDSTGDAAECLRQSNQSHDWWGDLP